MKYACLLLGLFNLLVAYLIIKYIFVRRLNNHEYFFIHTSVIVNMLSIVQYFNLADVEMDMKQYLFFIVAALAGIYSVIDLAKKLLVPTLEKKGILSNEEKQSLPVMTKDRVLSIIIYFISATSCLMLYRTITV